MVFLNIYIQLIFYRLYLSVYLGFNKKEKRNCSIESADENQSPILRTATQIITTRSAIVITSRSLIREILGLCLELQKYYVLCDKII